MNPFALVRAALDAAEAEAARPIDVPSPRDQVAAYRRLKQLAGKGVLDVEFGIREYDSEETVRYCWHFNDPSTKGLTQYNFVLGNSLAEIIQAVELLLGPKPPADTLETLEQEETPEDSRRIAETLANA